MFGAIIGDVVGSRFEFNERKSKDFELFTKGCTFTDDTVMTLAVAKALLPYETMPDLAKFKSELVQVMHEVGRRYPRCGYGADSALYTAVLPDGLHAGRNSPRLRLRGNLSGHGPPSAGGVLRVHKLRGCHPQCRLYRRRQRHHRSHGRLHRRGLLRRRPGDEGHCSVVSEFGPAGYCIGV